MLTAAGKAANFPDFAGKLCLAGAEPEDLLVLNVPWSRLNSLKVSCERIWA